MTGHGEDFTLRDDEPAPRDAAAGGVAAGVLDVLDRLRTGSVAAAKGFPDLSAPLGILRDRGVLRAVLPPSMGGCELGIAPGTARALCDLLRRIGRGDLALARLVEGHVNAALLVEIHGDAAAREAMRHAVRGGALLGVWGATGRSRWNGTTRTMAASSCAGPSVTPPVWGMLNWRS